MTERLGDKFFEPIGRGGSVVSITTATDKHDPHLGIFSVQAVCDPAGDKFVVLTITGEDGPGMHAFVSEQSAKDALGMIATAVASALGMTLPPELGGETVQ